MHILTLSSVVPPKFGVQLGHTNLVQNGVMLKSSDFVQRLILHQV